MSRLKSLKAVALLTLITFGLSACDSLTFWREDIPEPCPRITVLKNAAEMTRFKEGPGRDLIDVVFEAEVSDVLSACDYDVDFDTRAGEIRSQLMAVIEASRGPANENKFADLEYFVAIVNEEREILQKSVFPLRLAFPGNLTRNQVRDEPVDLTIKTDGSTDGRDYEIYVGLQLTREEMIFNRRLTER